MYRSHLRRRGASAIEFALCMPFVVTLLGGMVDGGIHIATMHAVSRAARDGARVGSTTVESFPATGNAILAAAKSSADASMVAAGFGGTNYKSVVTWKSDTTGLYWVRVTVTGKTTPFFGTLTPFRGNLTQSFTMVTQEQP